MKKMGGMGGIMGMMPGMGKMKDQMAECRSGRQDLRPPDRHHPVDDAEGTRQPELLKHSRKKRIAAGSGTSAADINKLLKMHRQMADMMKSMKGKKGGGMMGKMMGGMAGKMGLPGGGGMPDLSKMSPKEAGSAAEAGAGRRPWRCGRHAETAGSRRAVPGLGRTGLPGLPKKK
jgi:signal recognition particle subunit SRP54